MILPVPINLGRIREMIAGIARYLPIYLGMPIGLKYRRAAVVAASRGLCHTQLHRSVVILWIVFVVTLFSMPDIVASSFDTSPVA